jgi:YfiH family protein
MDTGTPGPAERVGPAGAGLVWRPEPPQVGEAPAWPPVLVAEDLIARGVVAAFTSRAGGSSPAPFDTCNLGLRVGDEVRRVLANRRRVLTVLGLAGRPLAMARQVHGAEVAVARGATLGHGPPEGKPPVAEADVLVTTDPEVVLAVLTADCVPVLMADLAAVAAGRGVVVAVHAGWRGLAAGAIEAGVEALTAAGGSPATTIGLVGPCIGAAAYEVGAEVQAAVAGRYPVAAAETPRGTPALDLAAAAVAALGGAGVGEVRSAGESTWDHPDRYFSHRRDAGSTGRQAGVIALVPPS